MSGKGSKRRPSKVDRATYTNNWNAIFGKTEGTVNVCPYCDEEVRSLPPDGIDYCPECEVIVEGDTITKEIP
jgi:hypothetical protein